MFQDGKKEGEKVWLVAGEGRRQEGEELLIHSHVSSIIYLDFSTLLHIVSISSGNNARLLNWCCQDGFYVVYLTYLLAFNLHLVSTSSCSACHGCD